MWLEKDNNEDPYNRGNDATGKTVNSSNVGAGAGGGAPLGAGEGNQTNTTPAGPNPVAAVPQQKSATVQDYLGANKEQGNQLGQQFQAKLTDTANKDKSAIDTAASNVKSQAQAGTVAYDPKAVNSAFNDPTKTANDPGQLNSFLKQWNASYTGPDTFENTSNYNDATKASQDAATKAAEVGDAGGRKQILQDEFGVYGQGNKGLDHTLLQNSDNFGQVLDTGKQFSTIPDYLKSQAQDVDTATAKAASDTAATQKNTQDLFANSLTNFQSGLTDKVKQDVATASANSTQVKAALASGDAKQILPALSKAGMDVNSINDYLRELNQTYGVKPDVSNYYTYNPNTAITPTTAASKDDFAKAAALQKLTGVDYSGVLNPADIAKAGTWNGTAAGNINSKDLTSYIKSQLGQQDKELFAKTNWGDFASKANTINVTDPKNYSNVAGYQDVLNKVLNGASRAGIPKSDPNLQNLYHQAAVSLVKTANGGVVNTKDPNIAGLYNFVREMGRYLYGQPQY